MKRPTTINLDAETRARVEAAQERLSHGSIRPSMGEVMREAINLGLAKLLDDRGARPPHAA